jgi:hypothetical protein
MSAGSLEGVSVSVSKAKKRRERRTVGTLRAASAGCGGRDAGIEADRGFEGIVKPTRGADVGSWP